MGRRVDWGDLPPEPEPAVEAPRPEAPERPRLDPAVKEGLRTAIRARAEEIVGDARKRALGEPLRDPAVVATELGLDLARECPVCRSLEHCSCDEADRSFVRRTRFLPGVSGTPRCPRCGGPMSTLYVPHRGTSGEELRELKRWGAIHACVPCQGAATGAVMAAIASCYRTEES